MLMFCVYITDASSNGDTMARPPKSEEHGTRSGRIALRVGSAERSAWVSAARRSGLETSEWARSLLNAAASHEAEKVTSASPNLEGLDGQFSTILSDPPWRFQNRTGKMAPEHRRLKRYETLKTDDLCAMPVGDLAAERAHLYLWCPNALLPEGLRVMEAWGFTYKSNVVWYKVRKDGGPDGRGVGFYFRNVTELLLFGVKGSMRTLAPGRRQTNVIVRRKEEHSRKPGDAYDIIESCSPGPYLELFARNQREGWVSWGDQADSYEASRPLIPMYNKHSLFDES